MSVERLIDELDDLIQEGVSLPLSSGKCIVDRDRIKELITEIRQNFPEEMRQAQAVVEDRNNILEKANKDADEMMKKAETAAKKLISQQEIVRKAAGRANEIVTLTQNRANDIKKNSAEYANAVLSSLEETLAKNLVEVRHARGQLKGAKSAPKSEQDA